MSVVCVRRSRERGLNSRSVRRRARARRRFSRLVAHRDGGEQCGARSVRRVGATCRCWPRAELCQTYQNNNYKRCICFVCLIGADAPFVGCCWSVASSE
eukprot:scaffold9674_cov66-Phaeocystis_antarctica.AAC.3